jgi:hypothetical protein
MNLNEAIARLKPSARRRMQSEAQALGLALDCYVGQRLAASVLDASDLVFVSGGAPSIWPADREG